MGVDNKLHHQTDYVTHHLFIVNDDEIGAWKVELPHDEGMPFGGGDCIPPSHIQQSATTATENRKGAENFAIMASFAATCKRK